MIRIGLSVQPSHFQKGFQSTATCGVFGSAIAASKLLNMKERDIVSALGIAGSYASGLAQFYKYGSDVKRIHAGKSSESGIMAALMVESGITGPPYILEGEFGFCHAYSDSYNPEILSKNIGKEFKIMETTIRPSACSARIQASVEATFNIVNNHKFSLSEIKQITIKIPRIIAGRLTHTDPPDIQAAQLSVPFSVAAALYKSKKIHQSDHLSFNDYENSLFEPEVRRLIGFTFCEVDEVIDKSMSEFHVPSIVEVKLNDGRRLTHEIKMPKGSPQNPFSINELKTRFISQIGSMLAREKIDEIFYRVDSLNNLPSINFNINSSTRDKEMFKMT